jgi:hypothetical protein
MKKYEPTIKQEQAIREYLHEAVIPLVEDVLVKKLGQAMSFCSKELISTEAEKQKPVGVVGMDVSRPHMNYNGQYLGQKPDTKTAMLFKDLEVGTKLYTAPPNREWVGLTDEELTDTIFKAWQNKVTRYYQYEAFYKNVETKLKEKNEQQNQS